MAECKRGQCVRVSGLLKRSFFVEEKTHLNKIKYLMWTAVRIDRKSVSNMGENIGVRCIKNVTQEVDMKMKRRDLEEKTHRQREIYFSRILLDDRFELAFVDGLCGGTRMKLPQKCHKCASTNTREREGHTYGVPLRLLIGRYFGTANQKL